MTKKDLSENFEAPEAEFEQLVAEVEQVIRALGLDESIFDINKVSNLQPADIQDAASFLEKYGTSLEKLADAGSPKKTLSTTERSPFDTRPSLASY